MVIILAADIKHHPKVPEIEQIISLWEQPRKISCWVFTKLAIAAVWRTGKMAFNPEITEKLGLESKFSNYWIPLHRNFSWEKKNLYLNMN